MTKDQPLYKPGYLFLAWTFEGVSILTHIVQTSSLGIKLAQLKSCSSLLTVLNGRRGKSLSYVQKSISIIMLPR